MKTLVYSGTRGKVLFNQNEHCYLNMREKKIPYQQNMA